VPALDGVPTDEELVVRVRAGDPLAFSVILHDSALAGRHAPADQRRALVLGYFGGFSQSEIARVLGWPLGTVKTRTRRALLRLREVLASTIGEELGRRVAPVPVVERSGAGALRSEVADGRR